jgi:Zn-finger nucleic acid-binding protein
LADAPPVIPPDFIIPFIRQVIDPKGHMALYFPQTMQKVVSMKCPVCKSSTLQMINLTDTLPAYKCSNCGGTWVSSNQYLAWVRLQPAPLPEKAPDGPFDPTWDTRELKLCPEDGHIIARFKIFPGAEFYLDHCAHCNGIWFDQHEWDALVARNMHDKINLFFTKPWQEKMRAQEAKGKMEKLYLAKFGTDDYQRIQEIRAWLNKNPRRSMLLAFLQADDPYKI